MVVAVYTVLRVVIARKRDSENERDREREREREKERERERGEREREREKERERDRERERGEREREREMFELNESIRDKYSACRRSGSLPEIPGMTSLKDGVTETFNNQVHWLNFSFTRVIESQPSRQKSIRNRKASG